MIVLIGFFLYVVEELVQLPLDLCFYLRLPLFLGITMCPLFHASLCLSDSVIGLASCLFILQQDQKTQHAMFISFSYFVYLFGVVLIVHG